MFYGAHASTDISYTIIHINLQTSNTALFLLFELAKHPEIQERLYREIKSVVEEGKHPTWEDIQNMKLVRNCVKETMRLYLPIGILLRVLKEDAVFNGYQVPAGVSTTLYLNYYYIITFKFNILLGIYLN